jgi:hypothetical protein
MKFTNEYQLPQSFEEAVINTTYDISKKDATQISVTTLINPPRISLLKRRHWDEITEDVSDSLWRILGSAVHYVMQQVDPTNRFIEEKVKEPIEGYTITGRPDSYDAKDKSVDDYKVTSVWAVKADKKEWAEQLNCYAWFFRKLGFPVEKLRIYAILRDWSRGQYKQAVAKNKDYPDIPFKVIDIDLWSFEEQEKYIKDRIALYKSCQDLADDKLPVCTEEDRWKDDRRCKDYCSCNQFCNYYKETYGTE